jgi:1,4-alpha-glucan branching enzyme
LLLAETTVSWPELTLPASKGGLGFDYRLAAPALPTPFVAQEVGLWLQRSLQLLQDGNRLQHLLSLAPVAGADQELQQLLMLALWSLPGRKHMRLDCQLSVGSNWQPERGHDWELHYATALCDARKALLRELNFLYQGNPCLYEQDASHEGINVLHSTSSTLIFERLARHGSEGMLVLINTADEASNGIRVRPAHTSGYRLCCRGGCPTATLPDQLQAAREGKAAVLSLSLPARTAAVYGTAN